MDGLSRCRGDWIRTSDPQHPMLIRYQTALRPEQGCKYKHFEIENYQFYFPALNSFK